MTDDAGPGRLTRRETMRRALIALGGLVVLDRRNGWAAGALEPVGSPPAILPSGPKPRARSVIQIWMWGGPPHLDTFDPKPGAGQDYCGPLGRPIATSVDGIRIGELLPLLARQAGRYSIIRSMTHGVNAHETASYLVQTGRELDQGLVYPCAGAVASLFRGRGHGYRGLLPPYIVLTTPQGRFSEAGFLGERHAPFATGGDPARDPFAVEGIVVDGITEGRQVSRRELLRSLDGLGRGRPAVPTFQQFDRSGEQAVETVAEAAKLFDLSAESDAIRDRYGRNTFGQSCLAARRLAEQGVPYITINDPGWDTHKQNFPVMKRKLPQLDQGLAALLQDLADRGLLESTIVWCGGEFGRTPRVQWQSPWNGGRGHHGQCFSALVAGGGFRGGIVVGASDSRGEDVADRPVRPQDLLGSIYRLMGIDPDGPLPNPRGLDVKVMPASGDGPGRGRLEEIL